MIDDLKALKQQSEFNKLAQVSNNLQEFSETALKSYIESVQEKKQLKNYRIKASQEYIRKNNLEAKVPAVYASGQNNFKPVLPEIFKRPERKRGKRKVDVMLDRLEKDGREMASKGGFDFGKGVTDMDIYAMNPLELLRKLEKKEDEGVEKRKDEEEVRRELRGLEVSLSGVVLKSV